MEEGAGIGVSVAPRAFVREDRRFRVGRGASDKAAVAQARASEIECIRWVNADGFVDARIDDEEGGGGNRVDFDGDWKGEGEDDII